MVWTDIAELPYLRVRLTMSRHDIVVIGYDEQAGVAFVVDNDRAEVQEVPFAALARARSSRSFPVPTRHTTFRVRWPQAVPGLRGLASSALDASVRSMEAAAPSLVSADVLSGASVVASGLAGIAGFVEDLLDWPSVMEEEALDLALRSLWAFVEKAGTGGGLFRFLQAEFCDEVARGTHRPEVAEAAACLRRCAHAWSEVAQAAKAEGAVEARWTLASAAACSLPLLERRAVAAMRQAAQALAAGA